MFEFVKDWQAYRAGSVTDALAGGVADVLRRRGIVREVAEAAAEPEKTAKPKTAKRSRR